jgi:hypothetical protein
VTQTKINKLAAPKIELRTVVMKNPKTGEEAKVATNYRMVKRWVKEALVTEGLLDKIYKNTELDDAAKITIAKALSIIKAMDNTSAGGSTFISVEFSASVDLALSSVTGDFCAAGGCLKATAPGLAAFLLGAALSLSSTTA